MKDICKIFIILLFFTSCSKKTEKVETEKLLDTISEIKVIKFGNARSVIFPSNYIKKKNLSFTNNYFTPTEQTIRYIETKLPESSSSLIYEMFGRDDEWMKIYKINAKDMHLYDKQYFG